MSSLLPTSSPLRIAVLGVDKIGSAFAFQLARAGHHDVTVVARPGSSRLRQLQHDHGIVDIKGERASVRVADTLDEETPYDLVIVTLFSRMKSMRELLPTGENECCALVEAMVAAAPQASTPVELSRIEAMKP